MLASKLNELTIFLLVLHITLNPSQSPVAPSLASGISTGFSALIFLCLASLLAGVFVPSSIPQPQAQPQPTSAPLAGQQAPHPTTPATPLRGSASSSSASPNSSASDEPSSWCSTPPTTPSRSPQHAQKGFSRTFASTPSNGSAQNGSAGGWQRKPRMFGLSKPVPKPSIEELLARHARDSAISNVKQRDACACVEGWLARQSDSEFGSALLPSAILTSDKSTQTVSDRAPTTRETGSDNTELGAGSKIVLSDQKFPSVETLRSAPRKLKPAIAELLTSPASHTNESALATHSSRNKDQRASSTAPTAEVITTPHEITTTALLRAEPTTASRPASPTTSTFVRGHKRTITPPHHPYAVAVETRRSRPSLPVQAERRVEKERPIEIVREALSGGSSLDTSITTVNTNNKEETTAQPIVTPISSSLTLAEVSSTETAPVSDQVETLTATSSTEENQTAVGHPSTTAISAPAPIVTPSAPSSNSSFADEPVYQPSPLPTLSTPELAPTPSPEIITTVTLPSPQIQAQALPTETKSAELQLEAEEDKLAASSEMEGVEVDEITMETIAETSGVATSPSTLPATEFAFPSCNAEPEALAPLPQTLTFAPMDDIQEIDHSIANTSFPLHLQHDNTLEATASEFGFPATDISFSCAEHYSSASPGLYPTNPNSYAQPQQQTFALPAPPPSAPFPTLSDYASLMNATLPPLPTLLQQQQQQHNSLLRAPASTIAPSSFANMFSAPHPSFLPSAESAFAAESTEMDAEEQGQEIQRLVDEVLESMDATDAMETRAVAEKQPEPIVEVAMSKIQGELTEDFVAQKRRELGKLGKLVNGRYFVWENREYERLGNIWTLRALPSHHHVLIPTSLGQPYTLYDVPEQHYKKLQDSTTTQERKEAFGEWFIDMLEAREAGEIEPEKLRPFDWSFNELEIAAAEAASPSYVAPPPPTSSYIFIKCERDTSKKKAWSIQYRANADAAPEWIYSIAEQDTTNIQNGDLQLLEKLVREQKEMMARLTGGAPPSTTAALPTFTSQSTTKTSKGHTVIPTTTTTSNAASAFAVNPFGSLPSSSSPLGAPSSSSSNSNPTKLMSGSNTPLATKKSSANAQSTKSPTSSSKGKGKGKGKMTAESMASPSISSTSSTTTPKMVKPLGLGDKAPRPSVRNQQVADSAHYTSSDEDDDMTGPAVAPKENSSRQRAMRAMPARKPRSRR